MSDKESQWDIKDLAQRHLARDPSDESNRWYKKMISRFGSRQAVITLPELIELLKRHDDGNWSVVDERGRNLNRFMIAEPFYQAASRSKTNHFNWKDHNRAPVSIF